MMDTLSTTIPILIALLVLTIVAIVILILFMISFGRSISILDHNGGEVHDPPLTLVNVNTVQGDYKPGIDYHFGVVENKGGFFSRGPKFNFYMEENEPVKGSTYTWHGRKKVTVKKQGSAKEWKLWVVKDLRKDLKT